MDDWCRECRDYKPPVLTATTALAISFGLLVGFLPAWQATDSKTYGGWWGIDPARPHAIPDARRGLVALLAIVRRV
jgi:hypothetical protein